MKNLVMCFDSTNARPGPRDATNAETLLRLLDTSDDGQLVWYDAGEAALGSPRLFNPAARHWRGTVAAAARESVVDAYLFLAEHWEPDDRIFLIGGGRGAYCARTLARMLDTVGMLPDDSDHVLDFALDAYALPGQSRTPAEWHQIHQLACGLTGRNDIAVQRGNRGNDGVTHFFFPPSATAACCRITVPSTFTTSVISISTRAAKISRGINSPPASL